MAPNTTWGRVFCIIYAIFGIPITGLMLKSIGEKIAESIAQFWRIVDRQLFKREPHKIYTKTVLCIFAIVITMILALAGLAMHYEGWTYFEGIYFAFITLSTIGFGDYVPQHPAHADREHSAYVIIFTVVTFLYFTVGLSTVSSALLAISRLFENDPPWGFVSLGNQDDDDYDDEDEKSLISEKQAAVSKAQEAGGSP